MNYKSKLMFALYLFVASTLIVLPAIAQKTPAPPGPPTQNVVVVNGTGQPVPTSAQGTTNVAGTVNIGNAPNVNVANTPSVNVANTPSVALEAGASVAVTSPLDGQGNPTPIATLEAVQVYGSSCEMGFNDNNGASCEFTAIPQGKELVVQEFDAQGVVETGNRPTMLILTGTITQSYFPYTFLVNTGGFDYLATHQETRVYVPKGMTPFCEVELPVVSEGGYICDISGFLVDVPAGQQGITVQHQKPLPQLLRRLPGR